MIAVLTLFFLILYFVTTSTLLLGMLILSALGFLATSFHRNRVESENKKKSRIEKKQLDILRQLALKEGIALPEEPPKETFSAKLNNFLAGLSSDDGGKALRLRLRGKKDGKKTELSKPEPETANGQKNKTQSWLPEIILWVVLISVFISCVVFVWNLDQSPELKTKVMSEVLKQEREREKTIRETEEARGEDICDLPCQAMVVTLEEVYSGLKEAGDFDTVEVMGCDPKTKDIYVFASIGKKSAYAMVSYDKDCIAGEPQLVTDFDRVKELLKEVDRETVTIEPDGYIDSDLSASSVGALVGAIHARGYPCSSVTIARKLWGKTGFKVKCNRSIYSYEVIINKYGDYLVLPN